MKEQTLDVVTHSLLLENSELRRSRRIVQQDKTNNNNEDTLNGEQTQYIEKPTTEITSDEHVYENTYDEFGIGSFIQQ